MITWLWIAVSFLVGIVAGSTLTIGGLYALARTRTDDLPYEGLGPDDKEPVDESAYAVKNAGTAGEETISSE